MAKAGDIWRSPAGTMDLRCGDWRDVLSDITSCDAVITDPPYSPRTHAGQRSGSRPLGGGGRKSQIGYTTTSESDSENLIAYAAGIAKYWCIIFSDHTAQGWHESNLEKMGCYVFAPVIWVRANPTPRLSGDGPTSSCDYITVARPKKRLPHNRIGSRPGHYITTGCLSGTLAIPGGKPLPLMRALILDYTLPGDLIVDPCAGGGTTLLAAAIEGRRAIGAEREPKTFDIAVKRLARGYTPMMDLEGAHE